jgi:hypothetical protein
MYNDTSGEKKILLAVKEVRKKARSNKTRM